LSLQKVVVHTDVLVEYMLCRKNEISLLRRVMGVFFCYTTVFHAIHLFSLAASEAERVEVERTLSAMKILGLNPKNARLYGDLFRRRRRTPPANLLIAGVCLESKLPLLTGRHGDFRDIEGLIVIPANVLSGLRDAGEMTRLYASRVRQLR
jgi:predicted nucleic acid-binding protein